MASPAFICSLPLGGREETKDLAVKAASTLPGFAVALQSECFVY